MTAFADGEMNVEQETATLPEKTEYGWLQLAVPLREIAQSAGAQAAGIWFPDGDGLLRLCALWGKQELSGAAFGPGEGLCGRAFSENRLVFADLVAEEAAVLELDGEARCALALPVRENGIPVGVLHMTAQRAAGLSERAEAALRIRMGELCAAGRLYSGKTYPHRPVFAALQDALVTVRDGAGHCTVLAGITLNLYEREILAVLGGRYSGKSVLGSVLSALEVPDGGRYFVNGKDLFHGNDEVRRKFRLEKVGYLSHREELLEDMTIQENLALTAGGDKKAVEGALEFVGLTEHRRSFPQRLSLAERRRAALARAAAKDPALLVADEPEIGLAGEERGRFLSMLEAYARFGNRSTLLAVSDSTAAMMADRVVQLQSGAVCAMVRNPFRRDTETE